MNRIVIAADGSSGGRAAVDVGLGLARAMGATATLVCVRPTPSLLLGDPYYAHTVAEGFNAARAVVADATTCADVAGVESESEILEGDIAAQIVRVAHSRHADLIVVGSRGHGAIAGVLLGSVSNAILHDADCPVLVVKERPGTTRSDC